MSTPIEIAREALEAAQNGLKWYRETYPDADSGADDEMDSQLSEALAALDALAALAKVEAEISELRQALAAAPVAQQQQGSNHGN